MYQLPKLSYLLQDVEPYIDIHTMGLHYYKHHANYLNQLNNLLIKNNHENQYSLEELVYHIDEFPVDDQNDILFNLGGVLNHNLYWKSINPNKRELPTGNLKKQIELKYGSYEKFFNEFKNMALRLKGSGYIFLVINKNKELEIINTYNQDTPLLFGYIPLFNIDMWEHAYYLNYENNKAEYIDNFKQIADFSNASKIYNNIVINT